ncbi:uncharacterized protein EMH_0089680 [Eimeria mitis]|uniref:Uncharacterized protein n=1 Tax=Eimeria mitis TaxID=44415 RepID=U6KAD6_9EIME|nr:uncharacterized protein EMH_0089680 [Eimeria mitis]CDJ33776.1 hypothetical protein, conserved [Eimeria mitis]
MGANNSTCLPCKVAGGNVRRNKPLNGAHDQQVLSSEAQVLKKVSTAAEPQGTSGTASQSAIPQDSSANAASGSSVPLQKRSGSLQLQGSFPGQSQSEALQQSIEGQRLQQVEELQDKPTLQDGKIPENETDLGSKAKCSVGVPLSQPKDARTVVEQQLRDGSPRPQQHIHVPSHMLAAGADVVCIKHQGTQQALLSPHSCAVAHRVAAALRQAAGERAAAAAAAARAAEETEGTKAVPKQHAGQAKEACSFQTESSAAECREPTNGKETTADSSREKHAKPEQEAQRTLPPSSCFPQVSCFSSNDESASEITVMQQAEQYQGKTMGFPSPEQSLISAAKLVGEMFSGAAAAAVAMATSTSGQTARDSSERPAAKSGESCLVADQALRQATQTGSDKGGDLHEGAVVLLGAVDRAVDAITSDEFKKQASTVSAEVATSNMLADV